MRRARCGTNNNAGSCITSSFRISIVESAIAEYCSQHFDLSLLVPESNNSKLDLAKYRLELKQLDTKIANYVKFISDGNISPAIISALDEAEKNKKNLQQKIKKSELNTLTNSNNEITAKWKKIKTNLSVYDEENTLKLRELIRSSIKRILVFQYGPWANTGPIKTPSGKIIQPYKGNFSIQITFNNGIRKTLELGENVKDQEVDTINRTITENGNTYTPDEYILMIQKTLTKQST